ncbi:DUF2461 domain-containing protein [Ethanoligenens sp.]|uniref:DUF2461 domain-containing protein n=1 Tax=Ethanoligenens sp. TaxID=2099655 RepID=UPI0039E873F0
MIFDGFSAQALSFLMENRLQNSKSWFEAHRNQYNALVLQPLRALVEALTPVMLDIDPVFTVEPKVGRTISRIFRDVRFAKDGFLFREEMWITFMRNKRCWEGQPGYYFSFGPDGLAYGYGYYQATPAAMDAMRQMILRQEPLFVQASACFRRQKEFAMNGDFYKRSRFPDQPPELKEWLDRRSISFDCMSTDFDILYSAKLVPLLSNGFRELAPLHTFFCSVEERRPHAQTAVPQE